ncbi:MAG: DEAD/DEAH box helicase family protein [bacterium]|nr:DEAD/DEAH box helicase family protein [bacterium]
MSRIIVGNTLCTIEDEEDINFLRALDHELSFKIQGAEHTRMYKLGKWDGVRRIMSRDLTFPYGLLERVKSFYSKHNKDVEIDNRRPDKSPFMPIDIITQLTNMGREPYHYQTSTAEITKQKDCGIIRVATGGGKTLIAAIMTAQFGKKTIIYVIGKDLLYQMHVFFKDVFQRDIGIVGDGLCDIKDINIVSVWTVGQALGMKKSAIITDGTSDEKELDKNKYASILDLMKSAKVHIFDECHLAACDTIQTISRNINQEHLYGMSASPWRDDNADLLIESIFGDKIIDIPASYLIENNYLVPPIIKFIKISPKRYPKDTTYPSVYKDYIIENEERNNHIIAGACRLVEQGYQTLVLYSRLSHGKFLYNEISKTMPCMLLSGKDSSAIREETKQKLESGEINCIIASTIFDIGVDLPSLSGLIIAGGGKSSVRALQRIGRVIRKYPLKRHAAILDFLDQAKFLKAHSVARYNIYMGERGFNVKWPAH